MANLHVTTFRVASGTLTELLDLMRQPGGFVDILRAAPGFRQYGLADLGTGEVTSISIWDSAADADAVSPTILAWAQSQLAGRLEMTYMAIGDLALLEGPG